MRPMKDAPRDGTPILLRVSEAEHGWVIAFWSDPGVGDTMHEDAGWYESEASDIGVYGGILGWTPLPQLNNPLERKPGETG